MDRDGYLTMVGRSKDLVIRGGENVPVVEVEQLLMEHPALAGVAVIGVPDMRLGEKVCAVVELKPGELPLSFDEMVAHLNERGLTRQFIPQYLLVSERLPRTAIGKIKKNDVRAEALEKIAQADSAGT